MQMNALDKIISYLSPQTGAKRARARIVQNQLSVLSKRKYEGAASGRRTDGWVTTSSSANSEIQQALSRLRDRSRDLSRNDPHAKRAISVIVTNTIGDGIVPKAKVKSKSQQALAKRAMELWKEWAVDSFQCDFYGQKNIYGLQVQALKCVAESGEVLVRKRPAYTKQKLAVPLQYQLLEPDFLDSLDRSGQVLSDGGYILQGIEYDKNSRIRAYYLFDSHPGEPIWTKSKLDSKRVPAEEIIHLFDPERVGQGRGVPWGSSTMIKLRDFNEYDDAQLMRQKIAACFSAFVYQTDLEDAPAQNSDGSELVDKLEPGTIELLPEGKDIKFANPPSVDGYSEFARGHLRQIATGYGITYESLTGDYSNVNYSSARMAHLQMQKNIKQWQSHLMIPGFCSKTWAWFCDAATLAGNDIKDVGADWTPPRGEYIDPTKEVAAKKEEIRNGFTSLPEVQREYGFDPKELADEIEESNKLLDKKKIILDCDPRNTTNAGMNQQSLNSNAPPNDEGTGKNGN